MSSRLVNLALSALVAATIGFGLYGRFAGLGTWPLGIDEFYISRSVDNILRSGWPVYPCGSYYSRGVLFQYLVALARSVGASPELAGRVVSATSSVFALPAAYRIGRSLQGRRLGWLLVVLLSVSVWEIEMGRFARMYAPFQAIFLWYVYFLLRFAIDGRGSALVPMLFLSLIGVLTWEGGALLGVLTLLSPFLALRDGRLRPIDRRNLLLLLPAVLVLLLLFQALGDARGSSGPDLGVGEMPSAETSDVSLSLLRQLRIHPAWAISFVLAPFGLALGAAPWLLSLRQRPLALTAAVAGLVCALAHQFVLCAGLLALALLTGVLQTGELRRKRALIYRLALGACFVYWITFALVTGAWHTTTLPSSQAMSQWYALGQYAGGFPNVFREFILPWARVIPLLTLGCAALIAVLLVRVLRAPTGALATERALLVLLVATLLIVGARGSGRIETRYTFFVYPLILVLSARTVCLLAQERITQAANGTLVALVACATLFGLSEDFQPLHVARIDARDVNFRVGLSDARASHYYLRADYRDVGAWLARNRQDGDQVALGIPAVEQYYSHADAFFLQGDDPRYEVYACADGQRERWTGLPLVHGEDALAARFASGRRWWIIMYPQQAQALLEEGRKRGWHESVEWLTPERNVAAVLIGPA